MTGNILLKCVNGNDVTCPATFLRWMKNCSAHDLPNTRDVARSPVQRGKRSMSTYNTDMVKAGPG